MVARGVVWRFAFPGQCMGHLCWGMLAPYLRSVHSFWTHSRKRAHSQHQRVSVYWQALRLYQDVLRLAPGDLAALNEIGVLYWDGQQDASLALAALKRGLEVDDRDAVLVANYGQ